MIKMSEQDLLCWLALFHARGLNHARYSKLLQELGSPQAIAGCSAERLRLFGLNSETINELLNAMEPGSPSLSKARLDMEWSALDGNNVVTMADSNYPPLLLQIDTPPPLLFVTGRIDALRLPQIAIIGSRNCSVYGRETATLFAQQLARAGLSICSGLAAGIDTAAHRATVNAEMATLAVMGSGIDNIYPESNLHLAAAIRERGALISEFPREASPKPDHFPRRNRIISGVSVGVVVIEAALRSGTLITARLAMEQNREVFAVPGSIKSARSRGCHRLIRDGAALVEEPEEILEAINSLLGYQFSCTAGPPTAEVLFSGTDLEHQVLEAISYDPVPFDVLLSRTNMPLQQLNSILMQLELKLQIMLRAGGYIRQV
jgi:DNA processing protein